MWKRFKFQMRDLEKFFRSSEFNGELASGEASKRWNKILCILNKIHQALIEHPIPNIVRKFKLKTALYPPHLPTNFLPYRWYIVPLMYSFLSQRTATRCSYFFPRSASCKTLITPHHRNLFVSVFTYALSARVRFTFVQLQQRNSVLRYVNVFFITILLSINLYWKFWYVV